MLRFLESRKENRIWYRGSDYALGVSLDLYCYYRTSKVAMPINENW